MNPAQLLSHFDRISDAPDAIPHLRQFILDLAVRGKLVEQDPRDEPASDLLRRIQVEKEQLVKVGGIKKTAVSPQLVEENLFCVPDGWCWSRLADVGFINPRNTAADNLSASFVPMTLISADYGVASKHEVKPWAEIKGGYTHIAEGDVALAKITPCFENGKSTVFRGLTGGVGAGTTELHVLRPLEVSANYVLIFLKSAYFIESGIPRMTGTAGQKRVPTEYFAYTPFPLPPLAEQHRIVAKVDELMALCDRLEAAQAERENRRDRLVASSLNRLNNGADADAFHDHARFYFNHLPRLTTRTEHIQQLRQTILNLAVRGKLVPQDPSDEPAEVLAGSSAKKSSPHTNNRDAPYELPPAWQWMQLGQVSELINGDRSKNYPNKAEYVPEGVAWINTGHIEPDGTLSTNSMHYITRKKFDSLRSGKIRPGDLVYCLRGATLGKTAIITQFNEGAVASSLVIVRLAPTVNPRFAYQVLMSPLGREQIFQFDNGSAQPNLSANNVKRYWIPIPPLAEQDRIVAKVDELMALCDKLETQLTTTHTDSRRLLDAVLHDVLATAG